MAIKSGAMQWHFQAADDTTEHQTAYWDTNLVSIQKSFSFPKGNTYFNIRSLLFRPFHLAQHTASRTSLHVQRRQQQGLRQWVWWDCPFQKKLKISPGSERLHNDGLQ